jgi:hypothetical protein
MSDETALSTLPAPGASMSATTTRRHAPKRNAKPKRPKPRHRNAGPPAPRASAPRNRGVPPQPSPTKKDSFVDLLQTLGGAAATSVIGAYAVKWGLHPELVSTGLGLAGGYFAWQSPEKLNRHVGAGAASAAGSQLLLLKLSPAPAASKPVATPTAPAQTAQLPRPKNADLGALPPGMLDAAFERARAELAIDGDGYPPGYEPEHHRFRHGPVMPDRP